jgi:hypothetical protein
MRKQHGSCYWSSVADVRNIFNRWFFLSYLTSTHAVIGTSDVQILNTLVTLV